MSFFFFVPPTKKKDQKEKSSSQNTIRATLTLKLKRARVALLVAGGLV